MTWSTTDIQYEGFPLLLRKPNHENVWSFRDKLTKLVCIENLLEKVNPNGLPVKEYNSTLSEFDHHMCTLFDESGEGIIFLIETYCGKRAYYYYTLSNFEVDSLVEEVTQKFKVNIESWAQQDTNWGFVNAYPVKLFP